MEQRRGNDGLRVRIPTAEMERLDRNAESAPFFGDRSKYTRLALRWFHRNIEGPGGRRFLADALLDDVVESEEKVPA